MYQNLSFGTMQEDQKTRNGQNSTLIFLHVSENKLSLKTVSGGSLWAQITENPEGIWENIQHEKRSLMSRL